MDFQIPEDMTEYAPLTTENKKRILGLNTAALYGIDVPEALRIQTGAADPGVEVAAGAREAVAS